MMFVYQMCKIDRASKSISFPFVYCGGSEKSRLFVGRVDDLLKHARHGYDGPAGCPLA